MGWMGWMGIVAAVAVLGCVVRAAYVEGDNTKAGSPPAKGEAPIVKTNHVPEVLALLGNLAVDPPRRHKNMVVFPIRYSGKQAPGAWTTLDDATAAGGLKVSEKDQASVPEVVVENTGDRAVLVLSGEIIKGGRQTRVAQKDAIIETKQKVAMAVFCVEQHRWSGGKEFKGSGNMAPASIQDSIKRGADQGRVWEGVRSSNQSLAPAAATPTESLDDGMNSAPAKARKEAAKKDLGKFSPPDTIGIAVADSRTGRVVGLELFGRRDLFERLQEKLIEGYALDLVPADAAGDDADAKKVTEKDVEAFIARVLEGTSRYEETPGSGRGIDLVSGTIHGKGVAVGESAIHLSIQDLQANPTPVRPIVNPPPTPRDPPRVFHGRE
jgi:hypothetical protein